MLYRHLWAGNEEGSSHYRGEWAGAKESGSHYQGEGVGMMQYASELKTPLHLQGRGGGGDLGDVAKRNCPAHEIYKTDNRATS